MGNNESKIERKKNVQQNLLFYDFFHSIDSARKCMEEKRCFNHCWMCMVIYGWKWFKLFELNFCVTSCWLISSEASRFLLDIPWNFFVTQISFKKFTNSFLCLIACITRWIFHHENKNQKWATNVINCNETTWDKHATRICSYAWETYSIKVQFLIICFH